MNTLSYLESIENQDVKTKCLSIFDYLVNKYDWYSKPAAKGHHHAYEGGLEAHTEEVIEFALMLNELAKAGFNHDDLIVAGFLHDAHKVYTYRFVEVSFKNPTGIDYVNYPCSDEAITFRLCSKVGLELSMEVISALEFAHGGWSAQARANPKLEPSKLSALIHCADMLSSRFGKIENKEVGV